MSVDDMETIYDEGETITPSQHNDVLRMLLREIDFGALSGSEIRRNDAESVWVHTDTDISDWLRGMLINDGDA